MKRRSFITLMGAAASWPLASRARSVPRVGYIEGSRRAPYMDDFLVALGELGYVAGDQAFRPLKDGGCPLVK